MTGRTRLRLAAHSLATIAGETGAWGHVAALDRTAAALREWYLELAECIRRSTPSPAPEELSDEHHAAVLRDLDDAVADGGAVRIRSAVGAALASDHVRSLRRIEPHLAHALNQIDVGADQVAFGSPSA